MISWISETLIATTLIMMLVMAIRKPVARRYGANAAYALWLAPALRPLLPPLPSEWLAERDMLLSALPDVAVSNDWAAYGIGFWVAGAVAFFSWHLISYDRFTRLARHKARWIRADGRIEIGQSQAVKAPVAFGLLWQTVMVPADFESRYSPSEQRLSITHEVTHHRRRDLAANMIALVMLALHWWNPIARAAYRAFRTDQEAACDADVLAQTLPQDRHAYGTALLKSALANPPLAACSAAAASTLKERLHRIANLDNARPTLIASLFMLIILAVSMLLSASTVYMKKQAGAPSKPAQTYLARLDATSQAAALPIIVQARYEKPKHEITPAAPKIVMPTIEERVQPAALPLVPPSAQPAQSPAPQIVLASSEACIKRTGQPCLDKATLVEAHARLALVIPALTTARAAIASDQVLDARIRADVLVELDAELASLRAELATLTSTSVPVSLQ